MRPHPYFARTLATLLAANPRQQHVLAQITGVSEAAISLIKRGHKTPNHVKWAKLVHALCLRECTEHVHRSVLRKREKKRARGEIVDACGMSISAIAELELPEWRDWRSPRVVPHLSIGHREEVLLDSLVLDFLRIDEASVVGALERLHGPSHAGSAEIKYRPRCGRGEFLLHCRNWQFEGIGVSLHLQPVDDRAYCARMRIDVPVSPGPGSSLWDRAPEILREAILPFVAPENIFVRAYDCCIDYEEPITAVLMAPRSRRIIDARLFPATCPTPTVYVGSIWAQEHAAIYDKGRERMNKEGTLPGCWDTRIESRMLTDLPITEFSKLPPPFQAFEYFEARAGLRTDPFVSLAQGGMRAIVSEHPRDWRALMFERLTPAIRIGAYETPARLAREQWKARSRKFLGDLGL